MTSTFVPNSAKSKFIVVDQSLRDLHGHHFVYSTSVAEAAAQRGFVSVILAHRRFDRCLQPDNINVIPWFRYAWYERRGEALLRSFVFRILALLRPGPRDHIYVFLRRLRRRVAEHKALDAPATRMPANFASPVFQAILESSFGVFPRVLVAVLYVLARTAARTVRTISPGNTNRSGFGATVMRGLTHVGAKKEDRVFIHTLSVNELESLLEAMLAADLDGVAHFHILLRGDPREPSLAHGGYHGIAICLGRFHACGLWPRHVTFFTDTEELRALYNALSPIRFIKAPIPVRRDLFHDGPRDGPATRARARKYRGRPINITYLGGARTEKGFHHLPQVVSVLWVDYVAPGKARFTIQSNFNVPGGEPGMAIAKSRLAKLPDDAVTLITRAMSEEDYQEILASSDVVILPYDQNAYGARSSGVLAQALAAGKPVVVPTGTWMASQIDATRGRTFETPADLSGALANAIENIDALSQAADRYKRHWRRRHTPDTLLDCLMAQPASIASTAAGQSGEEQRGRPAILYVMNADPLVTKSGSSRVALNQLEYLTRCGYRVFGVFTATTLVGRGRTRLRREAERAVAALDLCYGWVIEYDFPLHRLLSSLGIFMRLALRRYALDVDVELRRGFNLPQSLTKIVTNADIQAIFLNYVQNWPLVDRLHLQHKPVILETHDIQARQYGFRRAREVSTDDLDAELSLLTKAAAIICLNDTECAELKALIPSAIVCHVPPFISAQAPSWADIAGCTEVREIVAASQPAREDWCLRPPSAPDSRAMDKAHWDEAGFDLLYVSSSHHANVESFSWFYHEVFLPHLAKQGIRVIVAGNIDQAIEARGLRHPGIVVCGPVTDLRPLYAATKLVVLPITSGAGTSIKTVEALSFGKPVVATTEALRGLSLPADAVPTWDTADAFGREVLRLLDDREQRERAAQRGYDAIGTLGGRERYYRDMDAVFTGVLKGRALKADTTKRSNPPAFVEWSPAVAAFNRLMRGQIESKSPAPCDIETISQELAVGDIEAAFREMYDAFMIRDRHAPLLKAAPWLQQSLVRIAPSPPNFDEFVGRLSAFQGNGSGASG